MFGHKLGKGWAGGKPYFRITNTYIDGTGKVHADLEDRCDRCGQRYIMGRTHLPGK